MSSPAPSLSAAEAAPPSWRAGAARWWALGASLVVLVVVYALWPYQHWMFAERGSVMEGWVRQTATDSELYFCYAVPLLVGWLVYRKRIELARLPLRGTWGGLALAAFAMLLFWVGYKVDTGYLGFASIQVMLAALALALGGGRWVRALFLPWLFLAFAWPMVPLETLLAEPLRRMTARLAGALLNLVGVPVVTEGTSLESAGDFASHIPQGGKFRLDVANACSGLRSISALMMVSALYAIVTMKHALPRLVLFASSIPLAVLGNLVRLILLAVGSTWFGMEFAVGTMDGSDMHESLFHELAGYAVFAVALAGMFAVATMLEGRRHLRRADLLREKPPAAGGAGADDPSTMLRAMACVVLVAAALVACRFTPTTITMAEPGLVMSLPAVIGEFVTETADEESMSAREKKLLDEGVTLKRRSYLGPDNRRITSALVMGGLVRKSLHDPNVCLPDQGFYISGKEDITIPLANGSAQRATLMHVSRDSQDDSGQRLRQRALHIFWYQGTHGISSPTLYGSYARSYFDAIFRNLNHRWGQVSAFMWLPPQPAGSGDLVSEEIGKEILVKFVGTLAPQVLVETPR
jgi:exosortase